MYGLRLTLRENIAVKITTLNPLLLKIVGLSCVSRLLRERLRQTVKYTNKEIRPEKTMNFMFILAHRNVFSSSALYQDDNYLQGDKHKSDNIIFNLVMLLLI